MRYFIIITLLFIAITCKAEDTDLGKVNITLNQINHLSEVNGVSGIKGLSYKQDGTLFSVSDDKLSEQNKQDIISAVKNLPDTIIIKPKNLEDRITDLEKDVTTLKNK